MDLRMLVEVQLFSHGHKTLYRNPGAIEITSLWSRFASFQDEKHRLDGAQSWHIFEALLVF